MDNKIKEIVNQVKNTGPVVLSLSEGNSAGEQALIKALEKAGLDAEIVTINGKSRGLSVSPKWDHLVSTDIEAAVETSPLQDGRRVLHPSKSKAVEFVSWKNDKLTIIYKSAKETNTSYTYQGVPESVFLDLVEINNLGESIGAYVTSQIKPNYSVVKNAETV